MDPLPSGISLSRARVLRELFVERHPWMATVRHDNMISYGRVWAASAEEASHRAAIAGEVISIERAD